MNVAPIAALYAGLLGLLLLALSVLVIRQRLRAKLALGLGTDERLLRASRAQGNFVEYAPFALLLLVLAEGQGMPGWTLHGLGISLLAGRLAHAAGISSMPERLLLRQIGMTLTFAVLGLLSAWLVVAR